MMPHVLDSDAPGLGRVGEGRSNRSRIAEALLAIAELFSAEPMQRARGGVYAAKRI